jgi:UDP-2-acetamido-3-amino-2,3-dideoxy-glucuronate N-acetyltransferase
MAGVPAKQMGWMSEDGARLELPLVGSGTCACPNTGVRYRLDESGCHREADEAPVGSQEKLPGS